MSGYLTEWPRCEKCGKAMKYNHIPDGNSTWTCPCETRPKLTLIK